MLTLDVQLRLLYNIHNCSNYMVSCDIIFCALLNVLFAYDILFTKSLRENYRDAIMQSVAKTGTTSGNMRRYAIRNQLLKLYQF
jgi:hypothetical protein